MMTRRWLRPVGARFLVLFLLLALADCGGATTAPDGTGGGEETEEEARQDEQQWEFLLPDGTRIVGTPAAQTNDVTIVLSASEPAGWPVTFLTDVPLSTADAGYDDSQNVSNRVTSTVASPSTQSCTAGPGAADADKALLIYFGLFDGVPAGHGGVSATCFGAADQETFQVAFGAF